MNVHKAQKLPPMLPPCLHQWYKCSGHLFPNPKFGKKFTRFGKICPFLLPPSQKNSRFCTFCTSSTKSTFSRNRPTFGLKNRAKYFLQKIEKSAQLHRDCIIFHVSNFFCIFCKFCKFCNLRYIFSRHFANFAKKAKKSKKCKKRKTNPVS